MSARLRGGWRRAVAIAALACLPREATADEPVDPAIDVQLFEPVIGPRTFVTVADAHLSAPRQLGLSAWVTYLTSPFVVYNVREDGGAVVSERTAVVTDVLAAQLSGSYGLSSRLQLGAALPLALRMSGDGLSPEDAMPGGGFSATGLGDLVVEARLSLLRRPVLGLAGSFAVTLPTSVGTDGGDYLGDDLPAARGRMIADARLGERLTLGLNVGVLGRKGRLVYGERIGSQLTYGGAAAVSLGARLSLIAEVVGRTGLVSRARSQSPLEASGALRLQATPLLSVLVGGGAGLVEAIGAPGLRVFAGVAWAPDTRDADRDGVADSLDRCPDEDEDRDGFEDDDGCLDLDHDADGVPDVADRCPAEREDPDGFKDEDGCLDGDDDGDAIPDPVDRCPKLREDGKPAFARDGCPAGKQDSDDDGKFDDVDACPEVTEDDDGFEDWDGCPEDDDGDGIVDADDECRRCPEDVDGKADRDGCPDLDDDHDGVADGADRCPAEAETANGVADGDGCPDTGGRQLVTFDGRRVLFTRSPAFDGRDRLAQASEVDPIALVMRGRPEVTRWRIVVAARRARSDEATRQASQRQADALRAYLIGRGLEAERLEAIGAVGDQPTVAVVALETAGADGAVGSDAADGDDGADETSEADDRAGRDAMCPAALRAVPRPKPASGAPTPTPTR